MDMIRFDDDGEALAPQRQDQRVGVAEGDQIGGKADQMLAERRSTYPFVVRTGTAPARDVDWMSGDRGAQALDKDLAEPLEHIIGPDALRGYLSSRGSQRPLSREI